MTFVYLDGNLVKPEEISPKKHRYLGSFRPPINPSEGCKTYFLCSCGQTLKYVNEGQEHYKRGCFDIPQYASIQEIRRC
jgi:hypothetical protein